MPVATYGELMEAEASKIGGSKNFEKAPRNALSFVKSAIPTEASGAEIEDDFYELSVGDAKRLQASLREEV